MALRPAFADSRLWRFTPRLLGPVILALLLSRIPFTRAVVIASTVRLWPLVGAAALLIPLLALRTHRWMILVRAQALRLAPCEALAIYAFSVFAGVATPGRLGEFVKVLHLRQRGLAFGTALATVFLDRFLDVVVLMGMATWGLASFAGLDTLSAVALAAVVVVAAVAVPCSLAKGEGSDHSGQAVVGAIPARLGLKAPEALRDFARGLTAPAPAAVAWTLAESIAGWLVNWCALALLAGAIDIHVSFLYLAGASSVCGLLSMLPITILGLGTREGTLVAMLGRVGVAPAAALAFSLLNLLLIVANGLLCSLSLLSPFARFEARAAREELA